VSAKVTSVRMAPRIFVGLLVVAAFAALALGEASTPVEETPEPEVAPLPSVDPRCRLTGGDAIAHARTLEHAARLRWERVPFALDEAPRAALLMAEAEACFGAGQDRTARVHAAGLRALYQDAVTTGFRRARLLLRVALRDGSVSRARAQIAILTALLSKAPESAKPYRAELAQLGRTYAANAARAAGERSR
jgi:hypothetical protein